MIDDAILLAPPRGDALTTLWGVLGEAPPQRRAKAAPGRVITTGLAYRLVKRGISSRALEPLGDVLGLGKGMVAEYLDLDRSTAHRRLAKDQPLPTHAAESVLRLMELDQIAHDTFETAAEASAWLKRAHPSLDGETPLECAKSSYGAQRVKDVLLAIKYGGVL
jgi:putative toxin-antitoxin system antitoxin component (TIGR02293 family)